MNFFNSFTYIFNFHINIRFLFLWLKKVVQRILFILHTTKFSVNDYTINTILQNDKFQSYQLIQIIFRLKIPMSFFHTNKIRICITSLQFNKHKSILGILFSHKWLLCSTTFCWLHVNRTIATPCLDYSRV